MDANLSFKPAVAAVGLDAARSLPAAPAAPTDLPAEQTVTPIAGTAAARSNPAPAGRPTHGEVVIDPASRQVIYRVLDQDSRRIVWQEPDEATLRLRAYARAANTSVRRAPLPSTDVEA